MPDKNQKKLTKMLKYGFKPTEKNIRFMLRHHPLWAGCFALDTFTGQTMVVRPLPTLEELERFKKGLN